VKNLPYLIVKNCFVESFLFKRKIVLISNTFCRD